jgi:capsular polysaccharide biosynthesis protein
MVSVGDAAQELQQVAEELPDLRNDDDELLETMVTSPDYNKLVVAVSKDQAAIKDLEDAQFAASKLHTFTVMMDSVHENDRVTAELVLEGTPKVVFTRDAS